MAPTAGATDNSAAYASAPLGNNTELDNIEFVLNTSEELGAPTGSLKTQLASIYNLFANYSSSTPDNLTAWTAGSGIRTDLSAGSLTN